MENSFTIRQAERRDVPLLLEFIREIARYEKLKNEVIATTEMHLSLFFLNYLQSSDKKTSEFFRCFSL